MTKDITKIKDIRSTGRRIGRRVLYKARIPYKCVDCGVTSMEPPKDAPRYFDEIWPEKNRDLDSQLQVDHETKDLYNNELENINWRCPKHHKESDRKTEKGVSVKQVRLF